MVVPPFGFCLSNESFARYLVEQMDERRIWFEPDLSPGLNW
jgi:hypothetical protein